MHAPEPCAEALMAERRSFVVLHPGARLHYAVPALLHRAGMLAGFYTDITAADVPLAKRVGRLPEWLRPRLLTRLVGRRLPDDLPPSIVTSAPLRTLVSWALGRLSVQSWAWLDVEAALRERVVNDEFCGAQGLYTLSNGDLPLVEAAKARGMFVAHEQIINPHVGLILREERARFPGLEPQDPEDAVRAGIARDTTQWRLADVVIAPSEFVRGEIEEHGIPRAKIALLPYGVAEDWLSVEPRPVPGRVLFVGTVGLRKGSHYLAAASRLLRERRVQHEVRVVGPIDPHVIRRPELAGPSYVGQVPRAVVRNEFARASVFVLPTLSESFGLVHLEAMACGLPVITTPNCGSLVRDGVDGFVVPIRDAEALADRIEALLCDESLRMRMSASARGRAAAFTWSRYAEALISVLDGR